MPYTPLFKFDNVVVGAYFTFERYSGNYYKVYRKKSDTEAEQIVIKDNQIKVLPYKPSISHRTRVHVLDFRPKP